MNGVEEESSRWISPLEALVEVEGLHLHFLRVKFSLLDFARVKSLPLHFARVKSFVSFTCTTHKRGVCVCVLLGYGYGYGAFALACMREREREISQPS